MPRGCLVESSGWVFVSRVTPSSPPCGLHTTSIHSYVVNPSCPPFPAPLPCPPSLPPSLPHAACIATGLLVLAFAGFGHYAAYHNKAQWLLVYGAALCVWIFLCLLGLGRCAVLARNARHHASAFTLVQLQQHFTIQRTQAQLGADLEFFYNACVAAWLRGCVVAPPLVGRCW
jgi:hypothetical protein